MRDKLQKAKALVEKGQIKEALDLLKSISTEFKCAFSKCPGCGADAPMLQKDNTLHGECKKCGAVWGGKSSESLVKIGDNMKDETKKFTKKEVEAKLWELYRKADPDADAFSINQFAATGWLKKTLAIKLGLPLPEEKLEKAEVAPKSEGTRFISESMARTIRCTLRKGDSKKELIEEHERLVDVLKNPEREKLEDEAEIQSKELAEMKEEVNKSDNDMTKDEVIDTMLQMLKAGEEPALINRHSIAKYETVGEINDDVLKAVFRKAKRDYHALYKAIVAEELGKVAFLPREQQDMLAGGPKKEEPKAKPAPVKEVFKRPEESKARARMRDARAGLDKGLPKDNPYKHGWVSEGHAKEVTSPHKSPIQNKEHTPPKKAVWPGEKKGISAMAGDDYKKKPFAEGKKKLADALQHVKTSINAARPNVKKTSMSGDPSQLAMSTEKLCKLCKEDVCKCGKACSKKAVVKTDQKSPRGRDVVPEGELKEKMKEADEHTGPLKPIVKK